jgi:hypothetical protein
MNTLQDISLLQSPNTLILFHLTRTDLVLQLNQLVLQPIEVILVPLVSTHLSLHSLITEGLDTQVHLVLIGIPSAEEPYVSYCIPWALTEVEGWGGVKVVGVRGGAAGTETVDCGVVRELYFCKLRWPDTPIQPSNWHRYVLHA